MDEKLGVEILGTTGEKAVALGVAHSEFMPELRGIKGLRKFREMRDNDSVIGAVMQAMDMLLRATEYRLEPAQEDDPRAAEMAEFANSLFNDMEHSWDEAQTNILSMLPYGWSAMEIILKRRDGPDNEDPTRRSRYSDGLIGIRSLSPRPQDTLEQWVYEDDVLVAFRQRQPGSGGTVDIPTEKLLHFRTTNANNSPMGRSVLRNAYKPYYYATHIESIEAIAIERELNGLPTGYMPSRYLTAKSGTPEGKFRDSVLTILRDIKRNEQAAVLFPSDPYLDSDGNPTAHKMFEFKLASSEGTRDIDTTKVVERYRRDIARTVLADFLLLGSSQGSYALSKDKSDFFTASLTGYLNSIEGVVNRQLLPRIWRINGLPHELLPTFGFSEVAPVDLEALGNYIQKLSGAGFALFPDRTLEEELLLAADLPAAHREALEDDLMGLALDDETSNGNES